MPVLIDAYTPEREELTRVNQLRQMAPNAHGEAVEIHKDRTGTELRGSLSDHTPDLSETRGTHELHEASPRSDTEPHGMYWVKGADGSQRLVPHQWFIRYVARNAESIFQLTRESIGSDEETVRQYQEIGDGLRAYLDARSAINEKVVDRKVRQELDDASYQFCQAAKYKIDAEERAKFLLVRNEDAHDNEQIQALINRAQESAHEGFVLAYAIQYAGYNTTMSFEISAKRVLDYSCRRLTDWFAQRRQNEGNKQRLSAAGTQSIINNMFLRRPAR